MASRHLVVMAATFVSEAKEKEFFENIYPGLTEYIKRSIKGFLGFELTKSIGKERTYISLSIWENAKAADEWINNSLHMKLREAGKKRFIKYDLVTRWDESSIKGIEWSKCPICQEISSPPSGKCVCGFSLSHINLKMFGI